MTEQYFQLGFLVAFALTIAFGLFNPFELSTSQAWEVAALVLTATIVFILFTDMMFFGREKLWSGLYADQALMLLALNVGLVALVAIAACFALRPDWLLDILKSIDTRIWFSLYENKIAVHAFFIFSGALVAVLISYRTKKLAPRGDLDECAREKYTPMVVVEVEHARKAYAFLDVPIAAGFMVFFIVAVAATHSPTLLDKLGGDAQLREELLSHFLGGGVALSLLVVNAAYIVTRSGWFEQ